MRADIAIIAALLALLLVASCEQVIELDKSLSGAEGSSTDDQKDTADGTGGNPAEDIAEGPDSPGNGAYNDSAASADTAAPATDDYNNQDGADDEMAADNATMPDTAVSDDAEVSDDDPTSSFSAADCACGDDPLYEPVCCDGVTTVFNTCFANCLNYHTGQCASQQNGTCATQGGENDADTDTASSPDDDAVVETPDDDSITVGGCGCVPTDMNAWCCDGGTRYISECTATCECEGAAAPCD